jgi:Mrp family chromosome partitioning ATPase
MLSLQEDTPGFDDVLTGEVDLDNALIYYDELKLYVLAGKQPVSNASEILSQPKTWEIVEKLKEMVDYVILDCAPSAILTDASDLARYIDGAIFVVKEDYAKVSHIMDGIEHLSESSNMEIIGSVLNGAKAGLGGHGSYGRYGRYGSYGHGRKKRTIEV